jgi:hypothetical protein
MEISHFTNMLEKCCPVRPQMAQQVAGRIFPREGVASDPFWAISVLN